MLSKPKRISTQRGFAQHHNAPLPSRFLSALGLEAPPGFHRSRVTIDAIRDDILRFGNDTKQPTDFTLKIAISHAAKAFQLPNLEPMLHLNEVFDYPLPIWSSSPGLPWRTYGYQNKKQVVTSEDNRRDIRWYWHRIKDDLPVRSSDCCAFLRAHIAKDGEEKVRAVWGYPTNIVLGEAVFAVPLIEAYQKGNSPIAYGYETAKAGCARIRRETRCYKYFTGFDFKNFDKSVPNWLIDAVFRN